MDKEYIMGIDQGSTGSKVIVVDKSGNVVCSAYRKIMSTYPHEGWLEHDPEDVWESIREGIIEVSKQVDIKKINSIGITGQRETTVLWDRKTGKALTPAISWQCARSQDIVDTWEPFADEILITTGVTNNAYYSASKIAWALREYPGLREKCEKGEVAFGTPNTWILWKLTGGKSHYTDTTHAGRTLLYDVRKCEWSDSLISKMNIPRQILPQVLPCDADFGMAVCPSEAFSEPIPIRAMIGDQMSALFGQTCFSKGEAKVTIGTSLNFVTYTGEYMNPTAGILPAVASDLSGTVSYENEGGINIAGSINEWMINQLNFADNPIELSNMAQEVETNGLYFVPAFSGLFAPHWDPKARGLIVGLTHFHDKRHICRAGLESIALQTADVIRILNGKLNLGIKTIKVDGGVAKNDFLMQTFADLLNVRVERPENTDRTPMGAVYIAGLASGLWKSKDEIRSLWKLEKAYEPRINNDDREKILTGWDEAVRRSLNWIR